MRILMFFSIFISLLFWGSYEQAYATSLNTLSLQLSQIDEIQAQYTSEKHLDNLDTTLNTQGTFFISRSQGIILKQLEPFLMTLTAEDDLIKEETEDLESKNYTRKDSPEIFSIYDSIRDRIFNFNQQQLLKDFKLSFNDLGEQGYEMLLIPREESTVKLEYIKLRGLIFPNEIKYKISGDETVMFFSNINIKNKE